MGQAAKHSVTIPSDLAEAGPLQDRILEELGQAGFSDNVCFAVRLALDEALSNAIRHGNQFDPRKSVDVLWTIDEVQAVITVRDQGPGFDPADLPDPTLECNLERPHGRGVMLIRAYMTDVRFNERGNELTMTKRRDCPLPFCPDDDDADELQGNQPDEA